MSLLIRIYFNAVFGGLGGLLGWILFGAFVDPKGSGVLHWLLAGAVIGCSIGYFVVSVEAIRDRSLVRFSRLATYGLLLGALGGALGFLLGKFSYGAIGGALGGFVGGFLFGLFYTNASRRGDSTLVWGAVGLVIVGACIGSLSALVQGV